MSHLGPVFAFLVEAGEVPARVSAWQDAEGLLSVHWDMWQKGETTDFVTSASRNWWHQHLLGLICHAFEIEGLEFTAHEITHLGEEEIRAADDGLERLFQLVAAGRLLENPGILMETYSDILTQDYLAAVERARAATSIEADDGGFNATVSFFAFLKSIQAIVQQARQHDKSLLYVMPDFKSSGF